MNEFFQISAFAGVTLSLVAYMIGVFLKKKTKLAIFNPLMISIVVTIIVLIVSKTDYEVYNEGAKYLSWLLTPATVCLAIPLYEQIDLLKKNYKAVFAGILFRCFDKSCYGFCAGKINEIKPYRVHNASA